MTNHLTLICLSVFVVMSVGVTKGQVVNSVVTTTNSTDGSTITTITTTTTTSTNTSAQVSGGATLSPQEVVSSTITAFDKAKAEVTAKFTAVLAVAKNIQSLIRDTGLEAGAKLTNEYFLEGVLAIEGIGDFIRAKNAFIANTNVENIKKIPGQANSYYINCISKNADAAGLAKIITDLGQEALKIGTADVAFKLAVASCASKLGQAPACAASALNANPLPQVNAAIVNGLTLAKAHVKCLEDAISKTRANGDISIKSITRVFPEEDKFILPEKFDNMADRVLGQASSIAIPTDKLNLAKTTLQQARKTLLDAWAAKATTLVSARSSLDGVFSNFNNLLGNVSVSPETAFCLVNAKAATLVNLNLQASGLFQCILNIRAPATPQALLNLEASLAERETKESISSSTIQCYKDIKNAFYPNELQCCLAEAQDDYRVFLEDVNISGQTVLRKATEIVDLFKQCNLSAVQAAQKKFENDFSNFDKCLKTNTKITVSVPITNPIVDIPGFNVGIPRL